MARRLELHQMLCEALGSKNVYFQPPENFKMAYPCIVYERDKIEPDRADNGVYLLRNRYQVTVIDWDPDSPIPERIAMLPQCQYDRPFVSNNLHHDVFTIYY